MAAALGALAFSALAVPSAQAAGSAATSGQPYTLNVSFSNFKVAKAIKVGHDEQGRDRGVVTR